MKPAGWSMSLASSTSRSSPAPTERSLDARIRLPDGVNPPLCLRQLWQGPGDPTMHFEDGVVSRALRTPEGPASLRFELGRGEVVVQGWGAGAGAALDVSPALLGLLDDPSALEPHDDLVRSLARRFAGLRMTRGSALYDVLVPTIIAQKVTGFEARRSFRELVWRFGEPAPGPLGLRLAPAPERLRALPYYALHPLGLERRRADVLKRAAVVSDRLEEGARLGSAEARRRLTAMPGVGDWTAGEVIRLGLGDPDSLSVGDYNLPRLVSWALAGERRAGDARMLELLEPYRGQRARVVLLLELSGLYPPRRGPRIAARSIGRI